MQRAMGAVQRERRRLRIGCIESVAVRREIKPTCYGYRLGWLFHLATPFPVRPMEDARIG